VPWDYELSVKAKRRKQWIMQLNGDWESRLTQDMVDEERATAEGYTVDEAWEVGVEPESVLEPDF